VGEEALSNAPSGKPGDRQRQAESLLWEIGDWWNAGEAYGDRVDIVKAEDWTGPALSSCRIAGHVADRFEVFRRHNTLTFEHHKTVASFDMLSRPAC
jgi:hypothetical protein